MTDSSINPHDSTSDEALSARSQLAARILFLINYCVVSTVLIWIFFFKGLYEFDSRFENALGWQGLFIAKSLIALLIYLTLGIGAQRAGISRAVFGVLLLLHGLGPWLPSVFMHHISSAPIEWRPLGRTLMSVLFTMITLFPIVVGLIGYWFVAPAVPNVGCLNCGYDLTGNESGRCPECGTWNQANSPSERHPTDDLGDGR